MYMESHFGRVVTTGNNEDELMKPNDVGLRQRKTLCPFLGCHCHLELEARPHLVTILQPQEKGVPCHQPHFDDIV